MEKSEITELIAATYVAAFLVGCTPMEKGNIHGE